MPGGLSELATGRPAKPRGREAARQGDVAEAGRPRGLCRGELVDGDRVRGTRRPALRNIAHGRIRHLGSGSTPCAVRLVQRSSVIATSPSSELAEDAQASPCMTGVTDRHSPPAGPRRPAPTQCAAGAGHSRSSTATCCSFAESRRRRGPYDDRPQSAGQGRGDRQALHSQMLGVRGAQLRHGPVVVSSVPSTSCSAPTRSRSSRHSGAKAFVVEGRAR